MADLMLKRTLTGWTAADEMSADAQRKFPVGQTFKAKVTKPRNLKTHNRYWVLVDLVYQNTEQFQSKEQLHQFLKLRAGRCTPIVSKVTGEVFLIPDSISFDSMDEIAFQDFWRAVCKVVCEEIIPGMDIDEMAHEVEKIIGVAA